MSSFGKNQLILDTSSLSDSDNVGAYVRSANGTLITHTNNGGKDGLDVNLINTSIAVTATDLDIRNLTFATDTVDVSGSTVELGATTLAALENITVSATNLDIRDLAFATDKVDVSGSTVELGSTTLAALESITVSATDLDIRDLSHTQDSIKIGDGTDFLAINADGSINVNADISVVSGSEKAEDAAHASGDIGQFMLAVRQDANTSMVSADGDYAPLQVNATGALKVAGTFTQSSASDILAQSITVGTTEVALPASPLANRREIVIQNRGSKHLYIGETGVTTSTGLGIGPGAEASFEFGPSVVLYGISTSAGQDIRIVEIV